MTGQAGPRASTLRRLLDDNVRFDLAGRGTVNHLPMALFALSQLGADDDRLSEYFAWWEKNRALPRRGGGAVGREDWRRVIGEPDMFAALSQTFRAWIEECGSARVVGAVFPEVAGGVAAAAFHGLIRLAYGIEADHPGEIAAGLAVLCTRHADLELSPAMTPPPAASVEAVFARLADRLAGIAFAGEGIIGRMRAAAADPRFRAALAPPPAGPSPLADLARTSIALYWQTGDFTVLHMVTAGHAARVLFERNPQLAAADAIRALWGAACAAYASAGAPPLGGESPPTEPPPWPEIFAGAITSSDDHVIKMTYTCHREDRRYGNPLYRAAAARLVATGRA